MRTNPLLQALFVIGERVIYLVPQVTIFVLISRYLGREVFGQYTLVLTWATLFQTLANFGITECLAREIGREPEQASRYFTHGLVLAVGFAGIAMAVMVPAVWVLRYEPGVTWAILLVGGTLVPAGVIGACRGVLLANGKVEYMMAVGLVEALILLVVNVYCVVTAAGLLPIVAGIVLAKVVASCVAVAMVHRRMTPLSFRLQRGTFHQLSRVTAPFGIAAQLPALRFDIFFLSKLATFGTLGLYAAATKVAELMLMFPMAFYLAMLPRVAGDLAAKPAPRTERLTDALAWYFALVIPVGIGAIALAAPIVRVIYGSAFVTAAPLLQIQMAAFLLTTVDAILMMICRASGFQRADLRLVILSAVANLILNALLIVQFEAAGAALAGAFSILMGLILRWRLVTRAVIRLRWSNLIGAPLVVSVLLSPLVLVLAPRVPWPVLGLGYAVAYAAIALAAFPFVHDAVNRVRQPGISTG